MGNKLSSIDYFKIKSINNTNKLNTANNSKYNYEIEYDDGKKINISLTYEQNYKFYEKYNWMKEFKPLINLNYGEIQSIISCEYLRNNNDDTIIYKIGVLYNDEIVKTFSFSKEQIDLFLRNVHNLTPFGKKMKLDFMKKYKYSN